jgi:hypothetical protein
LNSRVNFLRGAYSIKHLLKGNIAPIEVSIKRGYLHFDLNALLNFDAQPLAQPDRSPAALARRPLGAAELGLLGGAAHRVQQMQSAGEFFATTGCARS